MTAGSAYWIAAVRARETERPDRLFDDPFARDLSGPRGVEIMTASERASGGENAFIPVRVRWFDDLVAATTTAGIRQVVLLGAGLDTRPHRLDLPADLDWYELDRAELFAAKEPLLAAATPRCRRHTVPADLAGDWATPLLAAGLDTRRETLWLAEGLFFYLAEDQILALLRSAAHLSVPPSLIAADIMGTTGLDSLALRPYRDWCAAQGIPPPFGTDEPTALLQAGGWRPAHITAPGAPDANYGRLTPQPTGLRPGRPHLVTGQLPTTDPDPARATKAALPERWRRAGPGEKDTTV